LLNPNGSRAGVQGGLYPPRPASPAFGSPIRREAAMEEEEEEIAVETALRAKGEMDVDDDDMEAVKRKEKRRGKERDTDFVTDFARTRERERKRPREEEVTSSTTEGKLKLKDVTNSPRSRATLPPLDTNLSAADRERHQTPETDVPTSALTATSMSTARTFLSTPATTPGPVPYLPTPRASSSPVPPACASETEGSAGGREKRTRKSVNYAEPKLNTKMRKPGPTPDLPTVTAKRQSSTNSMPTYSEVDGGDEAGTRSSLERASTPFHEHMDASPPTPAQLPSTTPRLSAAITTVKRRKSRPQLILEDEDSDGAQADVDVEVGRAIGWVNVEGRRKTGIHSVRKIIRVVDERRVEGDDGRRHSMAV